MVIVRRPGSIRLLAGLLLLGIPLFLLNLWVTQKGRGPLEPEHWRWVGIEAAWIFLCVVWVLNARLRAFWLTAALSVTLLYGNMWFLVRTKNYALAFYALFLLILSALFLVYLYRALRVPYFEPGRRWFEGLPEFLPRIEAELRVGDAVVPARLSTLGEEGCFAFPLPMRALAAEPDSVRLKVGALELDCAVQSMTKTKDGLGRGLRFLAATPDDEKDIRDFIDRVRSAGYVD